MNYGTQGFTSPLQRHLSNPTHRQLFIEDSSIPAVHEAMGWGQKSFKLVLRCHQLLFGFLAIGHLSVRSVANDRGDNEMMPGTVHRSPGI